MARQGHRSTAMAFPSPSAPECAAQPPFSSTPGRVYMRGSNGVEAGGGRERERAKDEEITTLGAGMGKREGGLGGGEKKRVLSVKKRQLIGRGRREVWGPPEPPRVRV